MNGIHTDRNDQSLAQAAARYGVNAGLIHAILADERRRLDGHDVLQGMVAVSLVSLPAPLARAAQRTAEALTCRPLTDHSFGPSQMKPGTLRDVAAAGYVEIPADLRGQLRMLLCPAQAPTLVAARVRHTIDHWAAHGVNLQDRLDILGTLYSLGLTGKSGVHPDPQANERGQAIAETARRYSGKGRGTVRSAVTA